MMQAGVVQFGGQFGCRGQQSIEWQSGFDEFVGGRESSQIFGCDEASAIFQIPHAATTGSGNSAIFQQAISFGFNLGRLTIPLAGKRLTCSRMMPVGAGNIPRAVFPVFEHAARV